MSLIQRARIEAYLPSQADPTYEDVLDWLILEFSYSFGGCTVLKGLMAFIQGRLYREESILITAQTIFHYQ